VRFYQVTSICGFGLADYQRRFMKKKKEHRHKWDKDYIDCPFCGGGEVRWCKKDECYKSQIRKDNKKWEDE